MPTLQIALPSLRPTYVPSAFQPVVDFLHGTMTDAGLDVVVTSDKECRDWGSAPTVVVAGHVLTLEEMQGLPPDFVFYNFEQLGPTGVQFVSAERLSLMARHAVWDYSRQNLPHWEDVGAVSTTHVPLGHHRNMAHGIDRSGPRDIDVLFYGSLNPRREKVLLDLDQRGLKVGLANGFYGPSLDDILRRARLVLNMHYYDSAIMEVVRLSHLWANRIPVVTEYTPGTEAFFGMENLTLNCPYDELADYVEYILQSDVELDAIGAATGESYAREGAGDRVLLDAMKQFAAVAPPSWSAVLQHLGVEQTPTATSLTSPGAGLPASALSSPAQPATSTASTTSATTAGTRATMDDPTYYGHERPEIVDLIPKDARRILDVGCARGALGAAVKRAMPHAEVSGIEYVQEAVDEASQRLDFALRADLNGSIGLPYPDGYFDVMIFGDVLEHLLDPERSLRDLLRYLSPTGVIVASIPNVKHWSVMLPALVNDEWQYTDAGLLDRTHVHLFTYVESLRLLRAVGLGDIRHAGAIDTPPQSSDLLDPLIEAMRAYGTDPDDARQLLTSYQYLFVAGRG